MTTKMTDLQPVYRALPIYVLKHDGHICLIDGQKNSTGHDIVLLFSTLFNARDYASRYPSLREAEIEKTTVNHLIDHFQGRVEYYIVDRPA